MKVICYEEDGIFTCTECKQTYTASDSPSFSGRVHNYSKHDGKLKIVRVDSSARLC